MKIIVNFCVLALLFGLVFNTAPSAAYGIVKLQSPAGAHKSRVKSVVPTPFIVQGLLLTVDGVPAVNASVHCAILDPMTQAADLLETRITDASGRYRFVFQPNDLAITEIDNRDILVWSISDTAIALLRGSGRSQRTAFLPLTQVTLHLLNPDGKPAAGVKVEPSQFEFATGTIPCYGSVSPQWSVTTDTSGNALIAGLPQGVTMRIKIVDPVLTVSTAKSAIPCSAQNDSDIHTIQLVPAATLHGHLIYASNKRPAPHIVVKALPVNQDDYQITVSKPDGTFSFPHVSPGPYDIEIESVDYGKAWTCPTSSVTLAAAQNSNDIQLSLVHGGVIGGKVIESGSRKPVFGFTIRVVDIVGAAATTRSDGSYTLRVPAGDHTLYAQDPESDSWGESRIIHVKNNKTVAANFTADAAVPVQGIVTDGSGHPAAGAEVAVLGKSYTCRSVTTGTDGRFTFDSPGLKISDTIYASLGNRGALQPVRSIHGPSTTLLLKPNMIGSLFGVVTDQDGKPVPNAQVTVNMQAGSGDAGHSVNVASIHSTENGYYTFSSAFIGTAYTVGAMAKGYAYGYSMPVVVSKVKSVAVSPIVMNIADSTIGGIIVDRAGNAIPGAEVSCLNVDGLQTTSDDHGHFHLDGVTRSKAIIEVRADNGRFASTEATSGREDNLIKAESMSEEEDDRQRFATAMSNDPTNHGNGTDSTAALIQAKKRAQIMGKRLIIVFHSSWSAPCYVVHRFFKDPKVKAIINSHFVQQDFDIWENKQLHWENPGAVSLYHKLGGANSLPFVVVENGNGLKLADSAHVNRSDSASADTDLVVQTLLSSGSRLSKSEILTLQQGIQRAAAP